MGVMMSPTLLYRRDLSGTLGDYVKQNATWDKCMEHSACKIPVFVGIAVGSFMILSLLWCVIRCCACGYACCSCCCGGCGGRRHKREKSEPVGLGPLPVQFHPSDNAGPQFAYYDTRSDDALPSMPTAGKSEVNIHVMKDDKEIEMGPVSSRTQSPMPIGGMQQLAGGGGGLDGRLSPSGYSDRGGGAQYAGTGYNGQPQQPRPTYLGQQQPPSFVTLDPRASPAPQERHYGGGGGYDDRGYQRNPPPMYGGPPPPQAMSLYGHQQQQQNHHQQQQQYDVDDGRRPQQQWSALG